MKQRERPDHEKSPGGSLIHNNSNIRPNDFKTWVRACLKIPERGWVIRDPPQPVSKAQAFWRWPEAAAGLRHSCAPFFRQTLRVIPHWKWAEKGAAYTDIARELELHASEELAHAIKIAKQIDYLGGMPCVTPKPVKTSNDPVTMLRADLENERTTVGRYRERIRQAEAMGEFALSETLRAIIVQEQEHEIDLSAALDINVPLPIKPAETKTAGTK